MGYWRGAPAAVLGLSGVAGGLLSAPPLGANKTVRAAGRGPRQPGQPQRPRRHRAPAGADAVASRKVVGVSAPARAQPGRGGPAHGPQGIHGVGGVTASMKS